MPIRPCVCARAVVRRIVAPLGRIAQGERFSRIGTPIVSDRFVNRGVVVFADVGRGLLSG